MKKTWQTINKIINKPMNSAINSFFTTDSGIISDGKQIADEFNSYFANVRANLALSIGATTSHYDYYLPPSDLQSAVFNSPDPVEIFNTIHFLNNTRSCGIDEIPSFIIKFCANTI